MKTKNSKFLSLLILPLAFLSTSCSNDENVMVTTTKTITIENVLDSKPLVQSGTFRGKGSSSIILPGQSVSFSFYAGPGQSLSFATMYELSNDLFFAPNNPGIKLYDNSGMPVTGDVSSQMELWDNGTRVNPAPVKSITYPGTPEKSVKTIKKVEAGTDDSGYSYLAASQLMHVFLAYNGNSNFTITLENVSTGTANETAFSPGVWAISHLAGGSPLMPNPIYTAGKVSANGLTEIAEAGNVKAMNTYLSSNTGTFTALSPVLVVVYQGDKNPFFQIGERDRGEGLKDIAQKGDAQNLYNSLKSRAGVKSVYILKEATNTALLPRINGASGGMVSQTLTVAEGDKIAIATMYGSSSDWFFATKPGDIDASSKGDLSSWIDLFDNGTTIDQYPGAGIRPAPSASRAIFPLPNPNEFTNLPATTSIIKVTLQ